MGSPAGRGRARSTWRTWSGTARCAPAEIVRAIGEEDVVRAVRRAREHGLTVRAAGTGHSFNGLACTDGLLVDLTGCAGITGIDRSARTVTVWAGTTLRVVSQALDAAGLALANIGTLADQTVGGAISTGNHGTGLGYGPLAGQVVALRLVTADGSVRACTPDSDPDLMRCARTALGAIGIITQVTLSCVPKFNLAVRHRREPLDSFLERIEDWAASADHVALSWLPWSDQVLTRAMSATTEPLSGGLARRRYSRTLDEIRCGSVGLAARVTPRSVPALGRALSSRRGPLDYTDASHQVFCFPQPVRFLALEHALPLDSLAAALPALRGLLRRCGQFSPYSVLCRVGAADDIPLSMSYGRVTGYLNLTVPRTASYLEVFRGAEQVLREFGGRPHWGKAHTANADILAPRYPEWMTFQRVRATLDPDGRFANDYLSRVLGPVLVPAAAGGPGGAET